MVKRDVDGLLHKTRVSVAPETFNLVSITHENWLALQQYPELSPSINAPFAIFKDAWEVTLIVDATDFEKMESVLSDFKVAKSYRLITFEADLEFDVVGYFAKIARILANAGLPIMAYSSFSRDHVFIRQNDLAGALKALSGIVAEVC